MLSVIISAYNDDEMTLVHVRECMNSSYVPEEIIVVDDCGKEGLKEKLKGLEIKTKLIYARVLEDIKWNYTGARNLGVWLSSGNFLSIEDNDHIPHKDYYRDALKEFDNPEIGRVKTYKRWVIARKDILNNPAEQWTTIASRPAHQDCAICRREVYLKVKGYDERFAGEYGWSATDWKRRMIRLGVQNACAGYMYVQDSPKTRGLSYRNFRLARQQTDKQSPHGILNFKYNYEQIGN